MGLDCCPHCSLVLLG